MPRFVSGLRVHVAALRILLILTVIAGVAYPAAITLVAQLPGLHSKADGSRVSSGGSVVGSSLLGQEFTDTKGNALPRYFQSRPSEAGDGYDPTASSASNLGPESILDTLPDPKDPTSGKASLLTEVCARSLAVGQLEHVDGSRPFCTSTGVGAVLSVFYSGPGYLGKVVRAVSSNEECPATPFIATYSGVAVQCAKYGEDLSAGKLTPIRGQAPTNPVVPADAVTASGSGLDPDISTAYADLQIPRVASARHLTAAVVEAQVKKATTGRALGFLGEPAVDVLTLNIALDETGH